MKSSINRAARPRAPCGPGTAETNTKRKGSETMKSKMSKRLLSWLLCAGMVMTMLPDAAFAAPDPAAYDYVIS